MTYTVTFSNPKQNYDGSGGASATVPCAVASFEHHDGTTSTMNLIVRKDVLSTYGEQHETTDANPAQVKSTVVVVQGSTTIFRGEVTAKSEHQGDSNLLNVTCQGKDGCLLDTFPNYTSLQEWNMQSDFVKVTELPLQASTTFGDFDGATLWPDPDDATGAKMYLQDANCPVDALEANIDNAVTEIELGDTFQGFDSRGWVKIESEWISYDGYDNADGNYKLRGCARGELDTAAAAHVATTAVYQKVVKTVAPVGTILENDPGTGWVRLRLNSEYSILSSLGCFLLQGSASGTYRATYSVYDIDAILDGASTVVSLSDVVQRMVTADASFGGAGFSYAGDCDFVTDMTGAATTRMQDLAINRYNYDPEKNPHDAWSAINQCISTLALDENIRFWFDHQSNKFRLAFLTQGASVQTITGVKELEKNYDVSQVFSAVRVKWDKDQQVNMIDSGRAWHQAATGTGASPDHWWKATSESPDYNWGPNKTVDDTAGNFGTDLLYDKKLDSKLGGVFTHDPGGEFDFGHFWFGSGTTPDTIQLDKIEIAVNAYRVINAAWQDTINTAETYVVRIDGATDYNTTTHTTANGWFDLGAYMEGSAAAMSLSAKAEFNDFTERNVNAIRVVFEYMCGTKTIHTHDAIVHELLVNGNSSNYVLVQTSATVTDDPHYVYAVNTHKKIRGGVNADSGAGCPRSVQFPGVMNSEASALTVGRFYLLSMLLQYQEQMFVVDTALATIPKLYQTITVVNESGVSYTGILMRITLSNEGGKRVAIMRLWNASANVISI